MPLRSQNSFEANNRALVHSVTIPGTDVKVAVRIGPAGDLLIAAAARWHREVEPLRAKDGVLDTWGYAERNIRGSSTTLSNHASGTALDLRARIHPLGRPAVETFTSIQIAAIDRIIADTRGALRWGGRWSRPDAMHIEVVASEAACARVLATFPPSATAPVQVAPAIPLPAPPPEEDDVDIRISPDQSGDFRSAAKVEVGLGTATGYTAAYLTLSSTWGATDFVATALGGDGVVIAQWRNRIADNGHWPLQLPSGTRTVTVEGTAGLGTVPVAALWHVR
jgi:hypothetical protein